MTDDAPPEAAPLTIGRLASLAGVTVRTLHHYDAIGLLRPGTRRAGAPREYSPADVDRLQRILFYRELEFPLDRIQQLVDDPGVDAIDHLRRQHDELGARIARLRRLRDVIETTIEAHQMKIDLTPEERLQVFGEHDPARHEEEVRARWGETDAYRESSRRTAAYGKVDWTRIHDEQEAITAAFAAALAAGEPSDGSAAMELAERARLHIDGAFYPCDHAMHRGLAELYTGDPRFAATYESRAAGLAEYVRRAINANADRADAGAAG